MLQRDTIDNCRDCRGTGQKLGWGSVFKKCTRCQGSGKYKVDDPGRCAHCDGTGRKLKPAETIQPTTVIMPVAQPAVQVVEPVAVPAKPVEPQKKVKMLQPLPSKPIQGKGRRK